MIFVEKILKIENSDMGMRMNGSSLMGKLYKTYDEIVAKFGEPTLRGGDKTQVEWQLEFTVEDDDGEVDYVVATIYDWKEVYAPETVTEWHIGGFNGNSVDAVYKAMGVM